MNEITTAELADAMEKLAAKLADDPVVSDDIKDLAAGVKLLAQAVLSIESAIVELGSRPAGRSINVNYGR